VPVAYLLGRAGFFGREFLVNENVLVPRPETEHVVDEALRFIGERPLRVLDVGTGCGAIACTIAAETQASVWGTDISPGAVAIAKENARRLGVADRARFYAGDLTEPVGAQRFDLVVANLPYVPTAAISRKPAPVAYEPREALDGGPDGLALYRRLFDTVAPVVNPNALILLEAAPPTMAGLVALAKSALPHSVVAVGRDYAGLDRYLAISCADSLLGPKRGRLE
jgi:release factor glutamine methyltransferase